MATAPSVLLCSTAWKGTLSASEVNSHLKQGLLGFWADKIDTIPMADGGDGWLETMTEILASGAQTHWVFTCGPLPHRPIKAPYLWAPQTQTAYLESAQIHGLKHLTDAEKSPMTTTSVGVGQAIEKIIQNHPDIQHLVVSVGGSASSDGGLGALQALGWQFLKADDTPLLDPIGGKDLCHIARIVAGPRLAIPQVTILVDVETTYLHAPRVFGPQKGASGVEVIQLTHGFMNVLRCAADRGGTLKSPGSGAAGGLAGALKLAFANGVVENGFRWTAQASGLDETFTKAQWVLSGEGRVDETTLLGKGTGQLMTWAKTHHIPLLLVCGSCTLTASPNPWVRIAPLFDAHQPLTESDFTNSAQAISQTVKAALPTTAQTPAWPVDDNWAIVCEPTVTAAHRHPTSSPKRPE